MRGHSIVMLATFVMISSGCEPAPEEPDYVGAGAAFLNSASVRRAELEASLVQPSNGYSVLRLQKYARKAGGWDDLPIWNPPSRPYQLADLESLRDMPLVTIDVELRDFTEEDMIALGKWAFQRWPLGEDMKSHGLLNSPEDLERYGVLVDQGNAVGGLVVFQKKGGELALGKTCVTCHAYPDSTGTLVLGAANVDYLLGDMLSQASVLNGNTPNWEYLAWGKGHVDSTPDGMDNPTGIPDLRPIRYQNHINAAGTVRNSLLGLAVRVETLMITSLRQEYRPPREIAFAVAAYLWSLGERKVESPVLTDFERQGQDVFVRECSRCHHEDGTTADPVPLELVGTDPATGLSPMRGTGKYRIPSLFGVSTRGRLLHRGQVRSLEQHLSAERLETVPGHRFGLALKQSERESLIVFLQTL